MKEELKKQIMGILKELGIENPNVVFEYPARMDFGDLSTNVAMMYGKQLGKKPIELAEEIKSKLLEVSFSNISKIEALAPGFINFHFDAEYFGKSAKSALSERYGKNESLQGQKTIIEYTVTNVLKPMHIGHLMGNVTGEALSRIIEGNGAEVKRNNYQGDSGLHIAKAVWGIRKLGGKIEGSISEKTDYIGKAYADGANSYEDDEAAQAEIKEINKKLFDKSDSELLDLYTWGREISLEHFEELYKKLGTKFDLYFFESEVADDAVKIIKEYAKKGLFDESEGAIVFHGEKYDPKLHTRVFINSQGLPTYEAKDIAHALRKYKAYQFDKAIIITADEQSEYFKVVLRALQEINPDLASKIKHIAHGMLNLPSGKMSSRKGNGIAGETVIFDVEEKVLEKIKDREFDEKEKQVIAEIVAIGAIKYSILHQAVGGNITFDFDKSISFEGDSGPYLQYATVRANSLLKKAEGVVNLDSKLPEGWQTTNLERLLERYPSVVEKAGKEYAPHFIVAYLLELSGEFNSFYAHHKIIDAGDPTSPYRLVLTKAFAQVMTSGLDLLGIKVPQQM